MEKKQPSKRRKSQTDSFVKLILIFFISLLSFSVGTFVGKEFSDNQYELSKLKNTAKLNTASTTMKADSKTNIGSSNLLTDEDIEKLAEEFISDKKPTSIQEDNPLKKKLSPTTNTSQEITSEKKSASKTPIAKKNASHKIQRLPSNLPSAVATSPINKYTIQVASYLSEEEAKHEVSKLKNNGFSAFYVSAKIKNSTWFRVSVGLFEKRKEAISYRKKLMKQAKINSAIVQKILR